VELTHFISPIHTIRLVVYDCHSGVWKFTTSDATISVDQFMAKFEMCPLYTHLFEYICHEEPVFTILTYYPDEVP
jgi:hypothetical protein